MPNKTPYFVYTPDNPSPSPCWPYCDIDVRGGWGSGTRVECRLYVDGIEKRYIETYPTGSHAFRLPFDTEVTSGQHAKAEFGFYSPQGGQVYAMLIHEWDVV